MSIKKVVVAGSGVLGSQIAFQVAYSGFDVTIYDINQQAIESAKLKVNHLKEVYNKEFADEAPKKMPAVLSRIDYQTDLKLAVHDADLVIEAIPEVIDIKTNFYHQLAEVAPEKTIFATNSSTLLPSQFAAATGRPDKFLALHFANEIWHNITAEIMAQPQTDPKIFDQITQFAKDIGMVAIPIKKEQSGYVLNSLLVPLLNSALVLWVKDVADPQIIDKTWMIATGSPRGPFAILDVVGIQTAYNILQIQVTQGGPNTDILAIISQKLKENYLDKGYLGESSGQGFYTYPNPSYAAEDFLKH
ncbi:3-hydroxyacyl-CoA dehydrogenase [Vagococcus humatus]|uniref:3-hydroxyacyl-CoA dehydrogenase n=1 Tax=Vagococcus humatus TaxID=1889241 RepID=A0A3R9YYC8_9ENTE|nr:3-hydroxyacyl-CoA dehydrogenase [Vagococcus humatus]RST90337.1 3-hydroxyacyl-CoA dehydrogenase [Vagococcus humatus]